MYRTAQLRKVLLLLTFLFSLPAGLYLVSQRVNLNSRAGGESANIVVDAATSYQRSSFVWKNLSQGGEEQLQTNTMLTPVIPQVRKIKPEYIRIDHIYDFYNVINKAPDGSLLFNWTKLDKILDEIKSVGAKPFLSLAYDGADQNWGQWQQIVQRTIEHVSRDKNIPDVYYEIWNEPDLFGGWKITGTKSYTQLYHNAVLGARRANVNQDYKIGGPATTALYENWFVPFLEYLKNETLQFDFYSWHRYSTNLDDFENDIHRANTWREQGPERFSDLEFVITEMGHNSEVDAGYDTKFGAIHTLATVALMDGKVSRAFSFEIKDGPGPSKLWGRWGLLTHEKYGAPEVKDRYKAFEFLQNMEGSRVNVIGQGSWVKAFGSNMNGVIRVLIVNYDASGRHAEAVPLEFANLSQKNYNYKRSEFLGRVTSRTITSDEKNSFKTVEYLAPNTAIIVELSVIQ